MLGNSWHLPTARFLLFVLLAACNVIPVTSGPVEAWYPTVVPLPWSSNLNPLGARPVEQAAAVWLRSGLQWDPREAEALQLLGPSDDPLEHLQWALRIDSVALNFPPHNPCLTWALRFGQSFGPELTRWRQEVVRDVQSLQEDLQDEQEVWLQSAPHHVRLVYKQGGDKFVLQPLVVLHLLRLFEFPGVQDLLTNSSSGLRF